MLGAQASPYLKKGEKQLSAGYRWQRSATHFVGIREQPNRRDQRSQVINNTNIFDITGTYGLKNGWSASLGIPYVSAKRSGRDGLDLIQFNAARTEIQGFTSREEQGDVHGIGDASITFRKWMGDLKQSKGNVQLGAGVSLPTGRNNVTRLNRFLPAGAARNAANVRLREITVDQSIQPGIGEYGWIGDLQAFRLIDATTLYFQGTYIAYPTELNGVPTFRNDPNEAIMSAADQYLVRTGAVFSRVFRQPWLSFGLGLRWEGVPAEDLFGGSRGFRRPGYAISIEPSLTRTVGRETFTVSVPIATQRNRQANFADEQDDGLAGDAAFADYLILGGYSRRW